MSGSDRGLLRAATWVATLLALPILLDRLLRLPLRIPLGYNEGWNAYHALAVQEGIALYSPGAPLFPNNYPPLSFYVVAAVGRLTGDLILAGRLIAIVALGVVLLNVGLATASLARSRAAGIFAAALAAATFSVFFGRYAGLDDPQMLGHAIMTTALVIAIRHWRSNRALALALLLTLLAGLVKQNLVALPLALLLGAWRDGPRRGLALTGWAVLLAAAAAGLLGVAYGQAVFANLLAPRTWSLYDAANSMTLWLLPLAVLIATFLPAGITWPRRGPDLVALAYPAIAIPVGVLFAGGAGVRENIYFDVLFGAVIVAVTVLTRVLDQAASGTSGRPLRALPLALCVAPAIGFLPGIATLKWNWLDHRAAQARHDTVADIARIRAAGSPALCENLALCYWAGASTPVDLYGTQQGSDTGRLPPDTLQALVSRGWFASVQLSGSVINAERWSTSLQAALDARYRLADTSANGRFYLRR